MARALTYQEYKFLCLNSVTKEVKEYRCFSLRQSLMKNARLTLCVNYLNLQAVTTSRPLRLLSTKKQP